MLDSAEEMDDQGDSEQEGKDVAYGLTDFHAEEPQHTGQKQNQGDKEDAVTGGAEDEAEATRLLADAKVLAEIGCFGIVLEKIPATLAAKVTQSINVPTIGIGGGGACSGQVLVLHDMLGLNREFKPNSCACITTWVSRLSTAWATTSPTSRAATSPTRTSSTKLLNYLPVKKTNIGSGHHRRPD